MRKIKARACVGDFNVPKPQKGRENHKQIANTIALVFRIISTRYTASHRQRMSSFFDMLFTRFINTD